LKVTKHNLHKVLKARNSFLDLALVVAVFLTVLVFVLISVTITAVSGVVIILTVLVLFPVTAVFLTMLVFVLVSVTVTVTIRLAVGLIACFLCRAGLGLSGSLVLHLISGVVSLSQGKGRHHTDHHDQGTEYCYFFHFFTSDLG
jgi:hypothetical protein